MIFPTVKKGNLAKTYSYYTPASVTHWDPPHWPPQWKILLKMTQISTPVKKSVTPLEKFS